MKILIVDDDRVVRLLLHKILHQDLTYEITEASDGAAAWTLLQQGYQPDLCILDVMMPRMDGLALLETMRSNPKFKRLKVIMCSAVNERFRVAQATSFDIDSYIVKPFTTKKVMEQVRKALGQTDDPNVLDPRAEHDSSLRQGMSDYLQCLRNLVKETNQRLEQLRSSLAIGDRASAATQLNAMVESGRRLGITGLADAAAKLEARVYIDAQDSLHAGVHRLEEENLNVLEVINKLAAKIDTLPYSPSPTPAFSA
jgi:two-component system, chemotaxis family, chemotaxis protein CheY